jgi:hypothetical protein
MNISRRGFLGALAAFTAAAAAKTLPTSLSAAPPVPEQVDFLAGLIKECRVTGIEQQASVRGIMRIVVTYRHDPTGPRTCLDDMARQEVGGRRPVNASVTIEHNEIDVSLPYASPPSQEIWKVGRPTHTVTVEYV